MALPQIKRAPRRPESINLVLGGLLQQKRGFCKGAECVVHSDGPRGNIAPLGAVAGSGASPYMGAVSGCGRSLSENGVFQP